MNWKEFFKPDLKKILLLIIFFIPLFFAILFTLNTGVVYELIYECETFLRYNYNESFVCSALNLNLSSCTDYCNKVVSEFGMKQTFSLTIRLIFVVIVSYVISCSFLWLLRNRKKSK